MQAQPVQQGGYIKPTVLPDIIFGILIATAIAFVESLPLNFQEAADSFLGRVVLFIIAIGFVSTGKWILALLMAILTLRLFRFEPITRGMEPFVNKISTSVKDKDLWFVEQALGENPEKIKEKVVNTQAVQ
jgi:hypothetical protein